MKFWELMNWLGKFTPWQWLLIVFAGIFLVGLRNYFRTRKRLESAAPKVEERNP
jgi:hypothetical protein